MNLPANVSQVNDHWFKANRHYLVSHIEWLKLLLQRSWPDHATAENEQKIVQLQQAIALQKSTAPAPFSIDCLSSVFELTEFEKLTLLLAIADEFDSSLLKNPQGEGHLTVNFSLALAILPSPEWDALLPAATLRKWGLVNIKPDNGLTHSRLMVPESIVHFLAGISGEDANVLKLSEPLDHVRFKLSNQSEAQANAISALAVQPGNTFSSQLFFTLTGDCRQTKRDLVTKIGQLLGVNVRILSSVFIPSTIDELNDFIMNWEREILLNNYFLYIECEASPASHADKDNMIDFFIDRLKWPVIVGADQKRSFTLKDQFGFEVVNPTVEEQRYYWEQLIDDQHKPAQNIEQVAAHFDLNYRDIQMCSAQLEATPNPDLWDICKNHANVTMESLAEKIIPSMGAKSLILPPSEKLMLEEIISHVKLRATVYQDWGLLQNSARGQGISVLFSGASGTGKTTAAEYLAIHLNLSLYRIDLSAIVSKYIGETEKNLRKIFAAAEKSGAILLFDEADALFSKRTQVSDSHDRHANTEVSYLLQRMESFRGLAILTSNFKESIDKSFIRRLRFIIQFPFPSKSERQLIWQAMLPPQAPVQALDFEKLAQLNVAGGNIRNITMNACFFAAASKEVLQMKHYLKSSRDEYLKLEKNLSESEVRSWV